MSKEYDLNFNDKYIGVEEPYENDEGIVVFGRTDDCSLHCLYKSYDIDHIDFFIDLIKYVADLEAKLAESEKKNFELVAKLNLKEHKPAFCTLADRDCEALGQVKQLKQQLAEKEKEMEIYRRSMEVWVEKCENHNQDKISFAVERLLNVRSFICDCTEIKEPDYTKVCDYIDNQIKQLKEGK